MLSIWYYVAVFSLLDAHGLKPVIDAVPTIRCGATSPGAVFSVLAVYGEHSSAHDTPQIDENVNVTTVNADRRPCFQSATCNIVDGRDGYKLGGTDDPSSNSSALQTLSGILFCIGMTVCVVVAMGVLSQQVVFWHPIHARLERPRRRRSRWNEFSGGAFLLNTFGATLSPNARGWRRGHEHGHGYGYD